MIKKEYLKPEVLVVKLQQQAHILIGSVTGLETTGLDEFPILPPGEMPGLPTTGGVLWDDAW
ncbi:MAG: hypothetical protein J5545_05165 [Bacteroidaceae bacterium]|nr:hypothetical protein [Bacteroidaceae bacterium]